MRAIRTTAFAAILCLHPVVSAQQSQADGLLGVPLAGEELTVQLSWHAPVDLDLFLTGPSGETIYFGNRFARAGYKLESETTCDTLAQKGEVNSETAIIQQAAAGVYRVSVDYIFDCSSSIDEIAATVLLRSTAAGRSFGSNSFTVTQQRLKTVAWEFEVLPK